MTKQIDSLSAPTSSAKILSNGSDGKSGGRGRSRGKNYCGNCGGEHRVIDCPRTFLKARNNMNMDPRVDEESAFFSHFDDLECNAFEDSPDEVIPMVCLIL